MSSPARRITLEDQLPYISPRGEEIPETIVEEASIPAPPPPVLGYYLECDGGVSGPFNRKTIQSGLDCKALVPGDLIRVGETGIWRAISSLPDFMGRKAVDYVWETMQANETLLHRECVSLAPWVLLILKFGVFPFPFGIGGLVLVRMAETRGELMFLAAGMACMFVPVFIILLASIAYTSNEFAVTTSRVLAKTGVIERRTVELFVSAVESVAVSQDVAGRILNYGTITVRGTGGSEEVFHNVHAPIQFRDIVQISQERDRAQAAAAARKQKRTKSRRLYEDDDED